MRRPGSQQRYAPGATDSFAPARSVTQPAARWRRPRPDAENFGGEVSWRFLSETLATRWLVPFDVRCLDDGPPLLDLGLVKGRERVWRLLLARDDMLAEVSQPLAHRQIGQPIQDRCIELADDILRRALGGANRIPNRGVEPGQPGLVRRRDIWRRR